MNIGMRGPFTISDIVDVYGSYESARLGVKKLVRREDLWECGEFSFHELGGRPEKVYASTGLKVKRGWVTHDTMACKYLRLLKNAKWVAGYDCDPKYMADGQIQFTNGRNAYFEMDLETESLSTVLDRLSVYEPKPEEPKRSFMVLFATLSQGRIDKLKERLKDKWVGKVIMFGIWHDLMKNHAVWETVLGKKGSICPPGG